MRTLEQASAALLAEKRAKVEARARELLAEEQKRICAALTAALTCKHEDVGPYEPGLGRLCKFCGFYV